MRLSWPGSVWAVWFASASVVRAADLAPQIPSVANFTAGEGAFKLLPDVQIVVDSAHGLEGSPSALAFAQTFRTDLLSVAGYSWVPPVTILPASTIAPGLPTIHIVVDPTREFTLYNGKQTLEGYDFEVTPYAYTIKAAAPLGAWWGMVTLLQQVASSVAKSAANISIPVGAGTDSPGWEVRGFMLDAGRHWFDTSFLCKLVRACIET